MDYKAHKEALERARLVRKSLACCNLCPFECGVDRTRGQKGRCGLDDTVRCFREMIYCGEESELVPCHQIYFAGCNLRCEFCIVCEWNEQPAAAEAVNFQELAENVAYRQVEGAKTLGLAGGEPAVNLLGVLELLGRLEPQVKVVWNSNMYYGGIVDELITGLVDVCLADFKCGNDNCAEVLLGAKNYVQVVTENILKASRHADLIVRHVVMPGHLRCCLEPILRRLAEEMPDVRLSLRDNYVPPVGASFAPSEYLKAEDMQIATDMVKGFGLKLIE